MDHTGGMTYNKITLSFPGEQENMFRKKYFKDSIVQFRIAFVILTLLYGIFGILDTLMFPEYAPVFHKIRFAVVIPFLLIVFALSFTRIFQKIWQILILICFVVGGSGIGIMVMHAPENYSYYGGMMLVFAAGYFFIKLRFLLASIAGWTTLLIFNLGMIYYAKVSPDILINYNFFYVSANIIGMFAAYYIEYYARHNFFLNLKLDSEKQHIQEINKNLEKAVYERTQELFLAKEVAETNRANVTAIIEGTTENIWAFNKNYEILYINHSFQKEFHHAFGVWLVPGSNLISALPAGIQSIWKERYDRVLRNEQFTIEDAIDTEIGKVFVQVVFNPIIKKGQVYGGSCFGSNITGRKMAELELLKAKEKAEESDRLKSAFLANMSHEIRTPMNGILGFARLLDKPDLESDKKHEYITVIQKSGIRMLNIINDIIDISKIEAGLMTLDLTESNINEQVLYIYTFFKPEVEAKGMKLICVNSLPAKESVIVTDREKLFAILINLVKNAIKYSLEGTIEFGYLKKGSRLEFFVKDTGIGIPKDRHDAIFERFIQADIEDKMARQGAGLGLAISKAYIEMLGGKIWVESEPGTGSTFYFTLPMNTSGEIKENSHVVAQNEEIKEIELPIKKIKILIAEDDEISEILLRNLVRNICKEIITSKTGIEIIDVCRKNPDIDLVLMDIQMPQLNGYIATQKIREFNKNVVIIAQTANGLLGDREKAIEAGCNDYIAKPIDTVELLAMISQHFADQ